MIPRFLQCVLFVVSSVIHVSIVDAKDYVIPAEDPSQCIEKNIRPCSVTTGDKPRMFSYSGNSWELDRNIVLSAEKNDNWNVYKGMLVLESQNKQNLHTPFADIIVGRSKVMIHVLEDRVRVLSLGGEGVTVKAKGDPEEHYIVPGFQNWFGGVNQGVSDSGVVSVIEFEDYAQQRARFFLNHQYGYVHELQDVAKVVKWATIAAAKMHQELVERRMASLEVKHQEKLSSKRKKIQFNKYLRKLFLEKIQFDY